MTVQFNQAKSSLYKLVGGFPEGGIIGQNSFIVASNDNADMVAQEDRFKYIDDLEITEVICLAGILIDYDFLQHVPSDIGVEQQYLPPQMTQSQIHLDAIQTWTDRNLMKINTTKTNYMIISRSQENFTTRLSINGDKIDRQSVVKVLGVWISEDVGDWSYNISQICKKAYGRISMLSKLKYAGVTKEDLIEIYCLFVRSRAEYCSTAFGSSITIEQDKKLTNIEKTCLRIILQEMYVGYLPACEMTGLQPISDRRKNRMLSYAKKCLKHPINSRFFPKNEAMAVEPIIRQREPFKVNFARTEAYKKSTIPTCQRLLNSYFLEHPELLVAGSGSAGGGPRPAGRQEQEEGEGGEGGEGEGVND